MSRKRKDSCDETPLNSYIDTCVNNMHLFDSFSKKKSGQGILGTSSDHVTSNQFQNNISCKIESDVYPSDQENNEPYEIQSDTEDEEQCTKNEDLCFACGYISAYEFFSFPIDIDIRKQWAKFCDISLDKIKPHFRLCDVHFKPEDYQISTKRRVLKPTGIPTLRPKPTLSKNASQNTTCSSDFRRNTTTADARNKRSCRNFKDITNNQNTIPPNAAKSTSKKTAKLGKFQILEKNLRTDIFRLKIRCSSLEDTVANIKNEIKQQVEECFVTRANTAGNVAKDIQNLTSSINASTENSRNDLCNKEARTDQRSVKDTLVGSAEQVTEDGYTSDSSMPSLEISIDDPQKVEVKPELFTEEVMLDEPTEKIAEDNHSVNSTVSPREISTDRLQNAKAILKPFSIKVTNAETSRSVTENNRYPLTTSSENSNSSPGSTEDPPAQHFEKVTPPEPENSDEDSQSPNSTIPSSEKSFESRRNAEARAGCSKNQENSGQGRITRSAKQKKHLPSVKKPTRNSSNVSNKAEEQMQDSLPYCCDICGTKFSHKLDWTRHQREHTITKPFHCQICNKQFASKSDLIAHGLTHSEKKPYKCRICDARFKYNSNKLTHERVHREGACFQCPDCGKKFSYKHYLITHRRVHSGVKPFSCQKCSKSFAQKCNLTQHQRTHSEDKLFKCRICKQQFKHTSNRATHERTHVEGSRFECAHCGNKFLSKRTLANHIASKCVLKFH
ncbi:zinc finger protein 37-like isoform X2 [Planococcus citri]|uniref:zinc finger protein 37-like isoform X2 n=1 Tax=Planococcus citri TaxID=170843 RepID=UPI0031F7BB52